MVVPRSDIPHEHFDVVEARLSVALPDLHGCNGTYLLMHRPGYTLSLDHVPPTEWSISKKINTLHRTKIRWIPPKSVIWFKIIGFC